MRYARSATRLDRRPLRDRMTRESKLSLEFALQLTLEAADALAYAHARGVVHRDIKPDNILIDNGHIASAIVEQLKVTLTSNAPLTKTSAVNVDAYNLYLKGRHLWLQRGQAMVGARDVFQRAIDIAPDVALAHARLADAVTTLGVWGFVPTAEVHAVAAPAAQRALALSPKLPEGDAALALYQSYTCGDRRDADARFRRVGMARSDDARASSSRRARRRTSRWRRNGCRARSGY